LETGHSLNLFNINHLEKPSRLNIANLLHFPVKFRASGGQNSHEIWACRLKPKKPAHSSKKLLDTLGRSSTTLSKKRRGRPRKIQRDWVTGRALDYEFQLKQVWDELEGPLLLGTKENEITAAFKSHGEPYASEFAPRLSSDILLLIRDPDFPKRAYPRIKFLARSLAGRPQLSFRSSRDICEKAERAKQAKSPYRILRREFYIECECGYRGPAFNDACRKCGAEPPFSLDIWTGEAPRSVPYEAPKGTSPVAPVETQEIPIPTVSESNSVVCECGATLSARTRKRALAALAKHRRDTHPESGERKEAEPTR
jgi:hypothetical protein